MARATINRPGLLRWQAGTLTMSLTKGRQLLSVTATTIRPTTKLSYSPRGPSSAHIGSSWKMKKGRYQTSIHDTYLDYQSHRLD